MKTKSMTEIDPTFEVVEQVTTHSGGFKWTQKRLHNNVWYFTNDAEQKHTIVPNWLMSNSCLSILLGVYSKTLSKYNTSAINAVKYTDAPAGFFNATASTKQEKFRNCIRTPQTMWTLAGVSYILKNVNSPRSSKFISSFIKWIDSQAVIYEHSECNNAEVKNEEVQDEFPFIVSADRDVAKKAANYIAQIINQWQKECILNSSLVLSNNKLKIKVKELEDKIIELENKIKVSKSVKAAVATVKEKYDTDTTDSLSKFISRLGVVKNVDDLTKAGLLNSDQMFSIFNEKWKSPKTGKLIHKNEFQAVIRGVFHTPNSTHAAPVIVAEALRNNYAAVCRVACKKQPNPVDVNGNILHIDNPAYTSNEHPCIRLQPRYTSKAVEYLTKNWEKLVKKHLAIK